MQKSSFQFSNPHIEKIDFRINETTISSDNLPISMEVKSEIDSEKNESVTKLNIIAGGLDDNDKDLLLNSIYFNGVISANFKWDENIKNPEKMLKVNGGAVLLSYFRPILATLTMQAGVKPLNLPFVNFTE